MFHFIPWSLTMYSTTLHHPASPALHFRDTTLSSTPANMARRPPVIKHQPLPCESCRWSPSTGLLCTRRRKVVKHALGRFLLTHTHRLCPGWSPDVAVEHR